jgi:hypothetical protein
MVSKISRFIHTLKPFDRRRCARFTSNRIIGGDCSYVDAGKHINFPAEIVDFSESGLLLMTGEKKMLPKTDLELHFKLPTHQETLLIHGTVVRTYRWYLRARYYSGVEFQNKNAEETKLLMRFFSQQI